MASTSIGFDGTNFGIQVGNNFGTITSSSDLRLLSLYLDDKLPAVGGATFDSYENQHGERCLPGTRTDLIAQIKEWVVSPQGQCIFWLNGMAGTGKSTISRTIAELFNVKGALGASFFFRRGEADRGNAKKFFPTIAKQLAKSLPDLLPHLQRTVFDNPGIVEKSTREQFDKLLLRPLLGLRQADRLVGAIIIVIDALDECEGDDDIQLILQLLPQLQRLNTHGSPSFDLRVFLTSRPELPVRLGFSKIASDDHTDFVLHEISHAVIKQDISLFFSHRLSKIRNSNFESGTPLPSDWPGKTNVEKLVELSLPLFIFAATVCRILEDSNWDPIQSLTSILTRRYDQSDNGMDRAYLPVLDRLLTGPNQTQNNQLVREFQQVIGSIVILESPLSITSLSNFLGLSERTIQFRLNPLHSVLSVPQDKRLPIRLFHLSFREFLLDPQTRNKTPFWVDENTAHHNLALRCILTMGQHLRRNICELPNDGAQRPRAGDHSIVDRCISAELQYSCRYLIYHLVQLEDQSFSDMTDRTLLFLQCHFLHWLEAMSLLGVLSDVRGLLRVLKARIPSDRVRYYNLDRFLHDAERFILKNYQIVDETPLQLYSSALIFAPRTSIIRVQFEKEMPTYISRLPDVEETWGPELQTLEGHQGGVWCVVFSPNGRILASSSEDMTVRLWDAGTGALWRILEGHEDWVRSIAFSPDGRFLASGSNDQTIKMWDTVTGLLLYTLEGHLNWVRCIEFSPNGRLLASGSNDGTVRIWNTRAGNLRSTLLGHSDWVRSIAFSVDGQAVLSCSNDKMIIIWDINSGTLCKTLEGHSGPVWYLAAAHNGRLLASGSDDGTVKLWNASLGTLHHTLKAHTSWVRSVDFSPDDLLVASGSGDGTVNLWATRAGTLKRTLKGHSAPVWSIKFCPKGKLASTSEDRTIRLWNSQTGALEQIFEGHGGRVFSLTFSPDSQILASGSDDATVKFWDTNTMPLSSKATAHSNLVVSMSFSPDGELLASGSGDKTVKIWSASTGSLQLTLKDNMELVRFVVFSPDSLLLASASDDEKLRLWDLTTGSLVHILHSHSGWVCCHRFSHDGGLLAFIQGTNTVNIFDISGKISGYVQVLEGHSDWVRSMAFSPDDHLLASGSTDKIIILWDTLSGSCQQTLLGHTDAVTSVVFSPDGLLLASGSEDCTIRVWNVTSGASLHILPTFEAIVWSVAFSPDSLLLASGLGDGTIWLWNVPSGTFRSLLDVKEILTQLRFTSDSHHLITNSGILSTQSWLEDAATQPILDTFVLNGQWIVFNGRKIVRLPAEYRPTCMVFKNSLIALGHASGRISFLEFNDLNLQMS